MDFSSNSLSILKLLFHALLSSKTICSSHLSMNILTEDSRRKVCKVNFLYSFSSCSGLKIYFSNKLLSFQRWSFPIPNPPLKWLFHALFPRPPLKWLFQALFSNSTSCDVKNIYVGQHFKWRLKALLSSRYYQLMWCLSCQKWGLIRLFAVGK